MSPLFTPCSNTFCDGRADKLGGLCDRCQKIADEQAAKQKSIKWLWAGFDKSTDNHRKGYKRQSK